MRSQQGSALVEAAIIFPCLILVIMWSAALTDVLILKLKAAEAARYALWETTVFKDPGTIDKDIQARFVDLRSPKSLNLQYTSLLMYPQASNIAWKAAVDTTSTTVSFVESPANLGGSGVLQQIVAKLGGLFATALKPYFNYAKFNAHGEAIARVQLVRARHDEQKSFILKGGDLLGLKGGNDLDHPPSMTNFTFYAPLMSEDPMKLVFDTWKAWPKPAQYTLDGAPTNTSVDPKLTYRTVEEQVSAQVGKVAFFGVKNNAVVSKIVGVLGAVGNFAFSWAAGGKLPNILSTDRMDGGQNGFITILPPEPADVSWAPDRCDGFGQCPTQRIGMFTARGGGARTLDTRDAMGDGVDRTRYTVPYKVNSAYWRQPGGTDGDAMGNQTSSLKAKLATNNEYVKTYACRGHFFLGSRKAGITDDARRYASSCNR